MDSNRFDEATLPQVKAAFPHESSWVLANAGSGKTRVLTNRVVRLLLAGTSPQKILCITFTNAAATNMLNRLGETLGDWAMLSNEDLKEKLLDLGEEETSLTPEKLDWARTLFARSLETPGGMKIQTFHSFATSLLRQFPLEADVSPQFQMIDEREATKIQIDLLNLLEENDKDLIFELARYLDYEQLKQLSREIFAKRDHFPGKVNKGRIWLRFRVPDNWNDNSFVSTVTKEDISLVKSLVPFLLKGTFSELKKGMELGAMLSTENRLAITNHLIKTFLTGSTAKKPYSASNFPTKDTREIIGETMCGELKKLTEKLSAAKKNEVNYQAAQKTYLLHQLAIRILGYYREIKIKNAWLDFEDLLSKVMEILKNPDIAQWILYRLDEDIDHILVDEAQDVNHKQWEIVSLLAEEFTSGAGQRGNLTRTVFAVGDEKQSIFGFQGAAPEKFRERRDYFKDKFETSGRLFIEEDLKFSFRSSKAILTLVDKFMEIFPERFYTRFIAHKPYKTHLPGRVELWPLVPQKETLEKEDWASPYFNLPQPKPEEVLAQNLVTKIQKMIDNELLPTGNQDEARPISPGDILILVRSRGPIYRALIRELKRANLPIAGTDRIKLEHDLAVKDLLALLLFLSVPKDDLSLAIVLKSPLFGFDEDDIFRLAHYRSGSLWQELSNQKDNSERSANAHTVLSDLLSLVDKETPYDLLETILTVYNGRQLLVSRLGNSCIEALDVLLDQALTYEKTGTASLTGFLEWLEPDSVNIKRQLEQQKDEIRVMSVHGAKGLESPIVILPDTGNPGNPRDNIILSGEDEYPLWNTKSDYVESIAKGLELIKEEDWKEYLRLLYVALTRAESRLIICGVKKRKTLPKKIEDIKDWYEMVYWVMEHCLEDTKHSYREELEDNMTDKIGHLMVSGSWPVESETEPKTERLEDFAIPYWVNEKPAKQMSTTVSLSPSNLGGSKVLAAEDPPEDTSRDIALLKGLAIHLLLEHLPTFPRKEWELKGQQLLELKHPEISSEDGKEWVANSMAILENPNLNFLFATSKTTLEEVAITAEIPELDNKPIFGYIDRLVISDDYVLAIDFKTNRLVPAKVEETPEGLLRQMGAYHRSLEKIYPDKKIRTAILWTETGELSELPEEMTLNALQRAITITNSQTIN